MMIIFSGFLVWCKKLIEQDPKNARTKNFFENIAEKENLTTSVTLEIDSLIAFMEQNDKILLKDTTSRVLPTEGNFWL
jgi:hypothetical protein